MDIDLVRQRDCCFLSFFHPVKLYKSSFCIAIADSRYSASGNFQCKRLAVTSVLHAVEFFGAIGLVMIVLEAGLDLKLGRNKIPLITRSFLAAFFILILSLTAVSAAL